MAAFLIKMVLLERNASSRLHMNTLHYIVTSLALFGLGFSYRNYAAIVARPVTPMKARILGRRSLRCL